MNSLIRVVIVLLISALSASEEVRVSVSQPQNLLSAEQAVNVLADKIGSDGLFLRNWIQLIRQVGTTEQRNALAMSAGQESSDGLHKLPAVSGLAELNEEQRTQITTALKKIGNAIPLLKFFLNAVSSISDWIGINTTGLDAFEALDRADPEPRNSKADLHKVAVVFTKTIDQDTFAQTIADRPVFAKNLLKYLQQ